MGFSDTDRAQGAGAAVTVEVDWDAREPYVTLDMLGRLLSQPSVDVPSLWEEAALYGVEFALEHVATLPCGVRIVELRAESERTNATVVAAAAAHAVWRAFDWTPPAALAKRIDDEVAWSRHASAEYLGTFDD